MEAFLTTLPPYVHEFLNKYPPTDVFHLLRELICFAVLYSDDRDRIKQSTEEFLHKREQVAKLEDDGDGVVPESPVERSHETIKEEDEEEEAEKKIETKDPIRQNVEEPRKRASSTLPSTFPDWWGHLEQEPLPSQVRKEIQASLPDKSSSNRLKHQSIDLGWVSWDTPTASNVRRERAKSQIIPNLRSYLEEDSHHSTKPIADQHGSTTKSTSTVSKSKNNRHSMINVRQSTSPTTLIEEKLEAPSPKGRSSASISKRRSVNAVPRSNNSPTSSAPESKLLHQANEQQKLRNTISKPSTNTDPPASTVSASISSAPRRSSSVLLKQPRINAAMRARAEHAKLQKEELERKKNQPPPGSSISMRIKQRANSGIDWESIKKEKRNTTVKK